MIELVVVLAVIALLSFMGMVSFSRFRQTSALDSTKQDVLAALLEARTLALSSNGAQTYGVHFETNRVIRFAGTTYATGTSGNVPYSFDKRVRMVRLTLSGGGSDIYFKRLTGEASKTGTLVVAVYGVDTRRATTTISTSGIIE